MINPEKLDFKTPAPQAQAEGSVNSLHLLAHAMLLGLEESTDTEGFTKPKPDKSTDKIMARNLRLQRRRTSRTTSNLKHR